jgi:hypothetical protein
MIGSRDARYAVTRKETQIVKLSLAGNASRINYSFKDCSNVGYGRVWGEGPPTPESSLAIYRHQQTGGLCRAEMQDRSRFVSITGIEVAASVSYITKPAQVQSLASCFLVDTWTVRAGCLCRYCCKLCTKNARDKGWPA